MLWSAIKVVNSSDLSFKVRDLRVVAYRMKPNGSFETIGNLSLGTLGDDEWLPYEGDASEFILGPSAEFTDLVGADHLPAQVMRDLMANPTALLFEIGSYSLYKLDDFGNATVNFATLGESVIQRTGLIVIDYGDGTVERHMVATNVYRYPDGSGRGLTLGEALDEVGVDHDTALQEGVSEPLRVLTRVGTVETYVDGDDEAIRGFWIVGGTGSSFTDGIQEDFDDIVLRSGDRVSLTYVEDSDGDGIFNREEYLLDTNTLDADTDDDGLSDYEESKVGWMVAVHEKLPYHVYSDPRFADLDEDYLVDGTEAFLGTDPYMWDTDADGLSDAFDHDPLVPPCIFGGNLSLSAWWDGSATDVVAHDVWDLDPDVSDGIMSRSGIAYLLGNEPVFSLNGDMQLLDFIDVPTAGLSPQHEFTVSLRVWWGQNDSLEPWGTILSKGPRYRATYALSVSETGQVRGSVWRRVHDKCWLGSCDGCCADDYYNQRTEAMSTSLIPFGEWVHVTLAFGSEYMKLYIDGEVEATVDVNYRTYPGLNTHHYHTEYLHTNADPLRIGLDQLDGTEGRFRGYLDDIQYFHRALSDDEVRQHYMLGICED